MVIVAVGLGSGLNVNRKIFKIGTKEENPGLEKLFKIGLLVHAIESFYQLFPDNADKAPIVVISQSWQQRMLEALQTYHHYRISHDMR